MANVVPIFVAPLPTLLHQNNIKVTYVGPPNFRMEPIRFVPLYFVVMPKSIITAIEVLFVLGVKSKPQTPRGTNFVRLHEDIPREMNKTFASQP